MEPAPDLRAPTSNHTAQASDQNSSPAGFPGFFISLEGIDGSGKSTLIHLLARWLQARGRSVVITREPGGTALGARLRKLLLEDELAVTPLAEALLMAADRAQHVAEVIRPALAAGKVVITDRYVDSSLAYQGYAGGVPVETVRRINHEATGGLVPDVTIFLDVTPEEAARRKENPSQDRFEGRGLDFQRRVYEGFLQLAREAPQRVVVVPGRGTPAEICESVGAILVERMGQREYGRI